MVTGNTIVASSEMPNHYENWKMVCAVWECSQVGAENCFSLLSFCSAAAIVAVANYPV